MVRMDEGPDASSRVLFIIQLFVLYAVSKLILQYFVYTVYGFTINLRVLLHLT